MKDFWQLLSLLTSLAGFLLVAGVLLFRGEDILTAAVRAVVVFIALWVVQNLLRAILSLAASNADIDSEGNAMGSDPARLGG